MPFKPQAQSNWAFATGQPFAKEFADKTNYDNLPKKVEKQNPESKSSQKDITKEAIKRKLGIK